MDVHGLVPGAAQGAGAESIILRTSGKHLSRSQLSRGCYTSHQGTVGPRVPCGDTCPTGRGPARCKDGTEQPARLREAQRGQDPQSCEFLQSFVSGISTQPGALLRINYPLTRFRFFPFVLF